MDVYSRCTFMSRNSTGLYIPLLTLNNATILKIKPRIHARILQTQVHIPKRQLKQCTRHTRTLPQYSQKESVTAMA
jgi:hypothetical protein